ncbi:MAG TPA: hypothetical protein VMB72_05060 [Acidimicrobiales bacterium]|nr:hypothetical protein [Acidimicrobiales bacterium]
MSEDDADTQDYPPRLRIGQRLLTLLPNLQRDRGDTVDTGDTGDGGVAGRRSGGAAPPARVRPRAGSGARDSDDGAEAAPPEGPDDGPVDAAEDDVPAPAPRPRLKDLLADPSGAASATRPSPADAEAMHSDDLIQIIKRIDDRERTLALWAAVLGAVVGIVLTAIADHQNPPLHAHGHQTLGLFLFEGGARVLLGIVVVAAALSRRRSLVGFALLFLGTSLSIYFALPFWGLGGWMIWRVFKYQRIVNARRGRGGARAGGTRGGAGRASAPARPSGGRRVPADPRGAARAGAASGRARAQAGRHRGKQPEPAGPSASKRYTPPKPPRPRPPAPSS